jgi:hypothetical protein
VAASASRRPAGSSLRSLVAGCSRLSPTDSTSQRCSLRESRADHNVLRGLSRGHVVIFVNDARTQNGHIRNDTRDASRRTCRAWDTAICRTNCVASDRACTRVTRPNFHGKEGVDGSSPSEGFRRNPANRAIQFVNLENACHAPGTCGARSMFARRLHGEPVPGLFEPFQLIRCPLSATEGANSSLMHSTDLVRSR